MLRGEDKRMKTILKVEKMTKVYGKGDAVTCVLDGIDLEVGEGEFVAVMGQSGSGKSTLLYNISGMDQMTSGQVHFEQSDIAQMSEKELAKLRLGDMGFVFQHSYLLKNMNIYENIILPAIKAGKKSRKEICARADMLLEKMEIASVASQDIQKVSGGQLQRAAICRALINEPKILFGDEPTGALNSKATDEVMDILGSIHQQGTTIMLVTHDYKVASKAERIIYLVDGKIYAEHKMDTYHRETTDLEQRQKQVSEWLKECGF